MKRNLLLVAGAVLAVIVLVGCTAVLKKTALTAPGGPAIQITAPQQPVQATSLATQTTAVETATSTSTATEAMDMDSCGHGH